MPISGEISTSSAQDRKYFPNHDAGYNRSEELDRIIKQRFQEEETVRPKVNTNQSFVFATEAFWLELRARIHGRDVEAERRVTEEGRRRVTEMIERVKSFRVGGEEDKVERGCEFEAFMEYVDKVRTVKRLKEKLDFNIEIRGALRGQTGLITDTAVKVLVDQVKRKKHAAEQHALDVFLHACGRYVPAGCWQEATEAWLRYSLPLHQLITSHIQQEQERGEEAQSPTAASPLPLGGEGEDAALSALVAHVRSLSAQAQAQKLMDELEAVEDCFPLVHVLRVSAADGPRAKKRRQLPSLAATHACYRLLTLDYGEHELHAAKIDKRFAQNCIAIRTWLHVAGSMARVASALEATLLKAREEWSLNPDLNGILHRVQMQELTDSILAAPRGVLAEAKQACVQGGDKVVLCAPFTRLAHAFEALHLPALHPVCVEPCPTGAAGPRGTVPVRTPAGELAVLPLLILGKVVRSRVAQSALSEMQHEDAAEEERGGESNMDEVPGMRREDSQASKQFARLSPEACRHRYDQSMLLFNALRHYQNNLVEHLDGMPAGGSVGEEGELFHMTSRRRRTWAERHTGGEGVRRTWGEARGVVPEEEGMGGLKAALVALLDQVWLLCEVIHVPDKDKDFPDAPAAVCRRVKDSCRFLIREEIPRLREAAELTGCSHAIANAARRQCKLVRKMLTCLFPLLPAIRRPRLHPASLTSRQSSKTFPSPPQAPQSSPASFISPLRPAAGPASGPRSGGSWEVPLAIGESGSRSESSSTASSLALTDDRATPRLSFSRDTSYDSLSLAGGCSVVLSHPEHHAAVLEALTAAVGLAAFTYGEVAVGRLYHHGEEKLLGQRLLEARYALLRLGSEEGGHWPYGRAGPGSYTLVSHSLWKDEEAEEHDEDASADGEEAEEGEGSERSARSEWRCKRLLRSAFGERWGFGEGEAGHLLHAHLDNSRAWAEERPDGHKVACSFLDFWLRSGGKVLRCGGGGGEGEAWCAGAQSEPETYRGHAQEKHRKLRLVASNARKLKDAEAECEATLNREAHRGGAGSGSKELVRKVHTNHNTLLPRAPNQPEIDDDLLDMLNVVVHAKQLAAELVVEAMAERDRDKLLHDGLATPVDGLALFSLAEPHTPDTPASVSSAPPATLQWGQGAVGSTLLSWSLSQSTEESNMASCGTEPVTPQPLRALPPRAASCSATDPAPPTERGVAQLRAVLRGLRACVCFPSLHFAAHDLPLAKAWGQAVLEACRTKELKAEALKQFPDGIQYLEGALRYGADRVEDAEYYEGLNLLEQLLSGVHALDTTPDADHTPSAPPSAPPPAPPPAPSSSSSSVSSVAVRAAGGAPGASSWSTRIAELESRHQAGLGRVLSHDEHQFRSAVRGSDNKPLAWVKGDEIPRDPAAGRDEGGGSGGGMSGTVYKAHFCHNLQILAVKQLRLPDTKKRCEWIIERLRELDHPHIVQYYGTARRGKDCLYVLMEYCAEGCLLALINGLLASSSPHDTNVPFPTAPATVASPREPVVAVERVRVYAQQLVEAVAHIHSFAIFHGAIRTASVFLAENGKMVKLANFGQAIHEHSQTRAAAHGASGSVSSSTAGTGEPSRETNATSMLGNGEALSQAMVLDRWGIGAVTVHMLTGKELKIFGRSTATRAEEQQELEALLAGEDAPALPRSSFCGPEALSFLQTCFLWNIADDADAAASALKSHPFLQAPAPAGRAPLYPT